MNLGQLICGIPQDNMFELKDIMITLSNKINTLSDKIQSYNWSSQHTAIEVAFYGRNILESAHTALLGRIDPYRLITIYKVQSDGNYDIGTRTLCAVEWTGDIISRKQANVVWESKNKKDDFDRALLGNYFGEVIWKKAFMKLTDYLEDKNIVSGWLDDILNQDEYHNFERCKSESSRLFSSFSKGVHSESLVEIDVFFDNVTMKDLIASLYKLCATLGLISHFIGYLVPNIPIEMALENFLEVEEKINEFYEL